MDKYEAGYQQQVEDVNEIVSLHMKMNKFMKSARLIIEK